MKILVKYNEKFLKIPVNKINEIISKYDKEDIIKGYELEIKSLKRGEINKFEEIVDSLKENKKIFQIKGIPLGENILMHYDFLEFYNKLAIKLGKKILVTYEPIVTDDKNDSIYKTNVILKRILKHIKDNEYKLDVSIQNVDDERKEFTPFDVINTLKIVNGLGFSFNIGNNYLKENSNYDLNNALVKKLKSVTIKNIADINYVRYSNIDFDKLFYYLNEIGYKKTLVVDLDFDKIKGEDLENKIIKGIIQLENLNKIIKSYQI